MSYGSGPCQPNQKSCICPSRSGKQTLPVYLQARAMWSYPSSHSCEMPYDLVFVVTVFYTEVKSVTVM